MERNISLDYYKIILALLVITIHIHPLLLHQSILNWFIPHALGRLAVPSFFIISGYYLPRLFTNKGKFRKYLVHLVVIFIAWSLIYIIPAYYDKFTIDMLFIFLFVGYYHLWYLVALFIGICILYLNHKILDIKYILLMSILLFAIGSYLESTVNYSVIIYRNGLFTGFPFLTIGYAIKHYNLIEKLSTSLIATFCIISLALAGIEAYISFAIYDANPKLIYITYPIVVSLFMLVLKKGQMGKSNAYLSQLSSGIYFGHIWLIILMEYIGRGSSIIYLGGIVIGSVLFSLLIIWLNKRVKVLL